MKFISIYGAKEHNLKNIDINIPREKLVVITGISGSGKSSLIFDTVYAEGQRRYMETFASYAKNFMVSLSRPEVDKIDGLSPVIAIDQKTTVKNPRSTIGTTTEIYDFLRLLYSKISTAYSYLTGEKMVKLKKGELFKIIKSKFTGQNIIILAPLAKNKKGSFKVLFKKISKKGYTKVRINNKISTIANFKTLEQNKPHNIEVVIDRINANSKDLERLQNSIQIALKEGKNSLMIIDEKNNFHYFSENLIDPKTGLSYMNPAPSTFSFNSPAGACPDCQGLGEQIIIDIEKIIPNRKLSIFEGGLAPLGNYKNNWIFNILKKILELSSLDLKKPLQDIPKNVMDEIFYGITEKLFISYLGVEYYTKFNGLIEYLKKNRINKDYQEENEGYISNQICSACKGLRLKKEALHFFIKKKNIAEIANLNIEELKKWINLLSKELQDHDKIIAEEPIKEILSRLSIIIETGLSYMNLNRQMITLSGGEAQRIRLATQIGNQLIGILYILDEPSIGLHQRDNLKLIKSLRELRNKGNSVIVIEHDKDIMLNSDYIIDIGPGAGQHGGEIISEGSPTEFKKKNSITAQFLKGTKKIEIPSTRREGNNKFIILNNCRGNNLENVNFRLPLGKIVCMTGVSGSGKSTLVKETLSKAIRKTLYNASSIPLQYDSIEGIENIDKLVEVTQKPIGRTPRSNPSTYTGVFTSIRNIFSSLSESRIRGYKPGRFSFNVKGGRCEFCEGVGVKILEMDFLPSLKISCEICRGKRYNRETLQIRYKGKSISDVLEMSVEKAKDFFNKFPKIHRTFETLNDIGLGYISLGQHATTISGGEAQRIKLATELTKKDTGNTLYILDEPTTGLHFQDIIFLLRILHEIVKKGNTVLIIEHNMDIIKIADYVIDMGPEGGKEGGKIIVEGTPEEIAESDIGYTSFFLKKELKL